MSPKSRFTVRFAPEVISHLDPIEKKYHRLIQKTIDEQLPFEPETETRNRKFLEQPAPYGATWELRFGPNNRLRAFYEVLKEEREVWILAIGVKEGNRLRIGREEFEL
jgi:mRNA-degrading endonuclease RelE of RelBE toxin-antitoxin system